HGTRAGFFGALARPLVRRPPPSVYTAHGLSYRKELDAAGRAAFLAAELVACRTAQHVISVSRADLEDLWRRRFVRPERGTHVPNAVDAERFSPGDREAARERLGLARDAFVVGTVARLVPQKSVGDLVAAAALVPGAEVVVVGDGPERAALQARANGSVRFLGARDDVPEVLGALDVFAL